MFNMAGQVEETKAECEEMTDRIWKLPEMPENMVEAKRARDVLPNPPLACTLTLTLVLTLQKEHNNLVAVSDWLDHGIASKVRSGQRLQTVMEDKRRELSKLQKLKYD
jgi:hypothetical protein